jgi:hypothetical protein
MIYGAEKVRDMGRSILPAKRNSGRTASRDKRRVNRARRRWDKQYPDCPRRKHVNDMREIVMMRRDSDHLNHFYRWSESVTAHLPIGDRLKYIKGILPKGLIGNHALEHLEIRTHFNPQYEPYTSKRYRQRTKEEIKAELMARADEITKTVLDSGYAKLFNRKYRYRVCKLLDLLPSGWIDARGNRKIVAVPGHPNFWMELTRYFVGGEHLLEEGNPVYVMLELLKTNPRLL